MRGLELPSIDDLRPRLIRPFRPEEVTTRSDREVDPRKVGLAKEDVDAIWRSVVRCYRGRLYPAISVCVRRRGEIVLDRTIGHVSGNAPEDPVDAPLVQATPKSLFNFFSGSKAITAMLVHLCHERELLHVDEPVATFLPEFGHKRKHRITIRDVLNHRAGIPLVPSDALDLDLLTKPEEILRAICDLEPISSPGGSPAYHALTGGFVLAAVIERVTGKDIRRFITDEIRAPLGFDALNYGVPPERLPEVAVEAFTGPMPFGPHKFLIERALGFGMPELVAKANDPRYRTSVVPAGNIIATAEEVSRFFEILNNGGSLNGKHVFSARTIKRAVRPEVVGEFDRVLMMPVPYSMGFMLGGELYGFYGPNAPKAFGHLGFTNVLGWADPERDIACAVMTSGKPLISTRMLLWMDIMRTIATRIPRDRRES